MSLSPGRNRTGGGPLGSRFAAKVNSLGAAKASSPGEANLAGKEADGNEGKHETSGSEEGTVRKYAPGNGEEARSDGGDQSDGMAGSEAKLPATNLECSAI